MPSPAQTPVFLFGTLRDDDLREIVFGRSVASEAAQLEGAAVLSVADGDWPALVENDAGRVDGELVFVDAEGLARADYFEGLFGYRRATRRVRAGLTWVEAEIYLPPGGQSALERPWSFAEWQGAHGPLARAVAADAMALRGHSAPDATARRWPMMRARAQARLNAQAGGPTTLRRATEPGDIAIAETRVPYARYFSVEEYDLRHRRFDGGRSETITRAAFISADAVTVLPYDPRRDHVLLIEQFRAGPLARGDAQCWSLEAVAGRIDAGETPEEAARREAREEARLDLGTLLPVASYYPTPGAKSEYLYSFLALTDLPADAAGLGGLAEEHEDIRAHVIDFAQCMALVRSGEINNAPLILSAMALAERRAGLRADAAR